MKKVTAEHLDSIVRFVRMKEAICLIDRRRYEELPHWLRKTGSIEDIIDEIGTSLGDHGVSEMFVYSNARVAEEGIRYVQAKPGYGSVSPLALKLPIGVILSLAGKLGDSTLWIDHGLGQGFQLFGSAIEDLKHVAILARMSQSRNLYVLQTNDGRAMSRKARTGNQYAIAFLSQKDGEYFIEDHKSDMPECHIANYKPTLLANDVLNSKLKGVTLDYKLETQMLLDREDLIDMIKIQNVIPNALLEKLSQIFPKSN